MTVSIVDIERALLTTIQDDLTLAVWLKTIKTYQGELEDEVDHTPQLLPAAFVFFRLGEYRPLTNEDQEADYTFSVLLVTQTLAGNQAARLGPYGGPGSYALLLQLRRLLVGNNLGITHMPPLLLVREESVLNTRAVSIYDAQYKTPWNVIHYGA